MMHDISDWRAKARFVMNHEERNPSLLGNAFGSFPHNVLFEVMENTAAFLKKNHPDSFGIFVKDIDMIYGVKVNCIAEKKARTATGEPAALIQFPGKTQKKEVIS